MVALRTVPVVLRHGERQLQVNALLDDGSTQTYLNADVAAELGFNGPAEQITVSVLNGQVKTFSSMQVDVEISSVDGETRLQITVYTTERVTGNLTVVDWRVHAPQ